MIDYRNANTDEFLQITSVMTIAAVLKTLAKDHPKLLEDVVARTGQRIDMPMSIMTGQFIAFSRLSNRILDDTNDGGPGAQRGLELAVLRIFGLDEDAMTDKGQDND